MVAGNYADFVKLEHKNEVCMKSLEEEIERCSNAEFDADLHDCAYFRCKDILGRDPTTEELQDEMQFVLRENLI
jgi:hypothetical protein